MVAKYTKEFTVARIPSSGGIRVDGGTVRSSVDVAFTEAAQQSTTRGEATTTAGQAGQ